MAFKNEEEVRAFTDWTQDQIRGMGRHVEANGLIKTQVVGRCVWAVPHQVFIGQIWPRNDRNKTYWIISGTTLPTDHIESNLADSARTAAKHFALKWQLESARMENLSEHDADATTGQDVDWTSVARSLQSQAETLYALVARDDLWEGTATAYDQLPDEMKLKGGDEELP